MYHCIAYKPAMHSQGVLGPDYQNIYISVHSWYTQVIILVYYIILSGDVYMEQELRAHDECVQSAFTCSSCQQAMYNIATQYCIWSVHIYYIIVCVCLCNCTLVSCILYIYVCLLWCISEAHAHAPCMHLVSAVHCTVPVHKASCVYHHAVHHRWD